MMTNADQQPNEIHPLQTAHRQTLFYPSVQTEWVCDAFFFGKSFFFFKETLKQSLFSSTVAELCGFPVTTDVWGFCGLLSPSLPDDQTPQEAEWIGFYGWRGCKDVHIKIKEGFKYDKYTCGFRSFLILN